LVLEHKDFVGKTINILKELYEDNQWKSAPAKQLIQGTTELFQQKFP
jgi:stress response protein SCP2